jgi:hypothetical protein
MVKIYSQAYRRFIQRKEFWAKNNILLQDELLTYIWIHVVSTVLSLSKEETTAV